MNPNGSEGGTGKNSQDMTEDEAKRATLDMVDRGVPYREITKVEFKVNGKIKHYSISQISRFVKEREDATPKKDNGSHDAAATELFENGKGPVDAVVELRLSMEESEELYKKWLRLKAMDLSQESTPRRLKAIEDKLDKLNVFELITKGAQQYYSGFHAFEETKDWDEGAPDDLDILTLIAHAKQLNSWGLFNLEGNPCGKCGSKGLKAIQFKCTKCGEENWWGHWPKAD